MEANKYVVGDWRMSLLRESNIDRVSKEGSEESRNRVRLQGSMDFQRSA